MFAQSYLYYFKCYCRMETSYQGGVSYDESDNFQRLSQTIASNIKKISQNGKIYLFASQFY